MTGSGDAAFTRSFNPYTGSVLNGGFFKGAIYEPLVIATVAGGGHVYPWLATSWKWTNGNKTLVLKIADNVKWSDGQPLTADDVVYSLKAGKQDKAMDIIGLYRTGSNIVSIKKVAGNSVAITLKTPDSQFIAANLNLQFVVPKHIWSKQAKPATFKNSKPVGSGPFTNITRLTTQDIVFSKNPTYWKAGSPKVPCLEYTETTSNDAALLLDPERQGRLDAQLRAERRERLRGQGSGPLPRVLRHDGVPDLADVRRHAVPVQPRAVPPGGQHVDQPR